MTAATHAALVQAARTLLADAHDEAAGLSHLAEEAGAALDERSVLGAIGTLATYDARLASLTASLQAAKTLLLRARNGCGR